MRTLRSSGMSSCIRKSNWRLERVVATDRDERVDAWSSKARRRHEPRVSFRVGQIVEVRTCFAGLARDVLRMMSLRVRMLDTRCA